MSEEFKAKFRRVWDEAVNKGNLDALDELYAPNVVVHRPPMGDLEGLEAYKQSLADSRTGSPDLQMTFDEILLEGENRHASRSTTRGTHTGQMASLPIPPTGKPWVTAVGVVSHMEEGKYVEIWEYADWLGLFQQLGVLPPLG
jgi:predicted ester cyclase